MPARPAATVLRTRHLLSHPRHAAATAFITLAQMLLGGWAHGTCPVDNPMVPVSVGHHSLRVEIAADPLARRCGLAFRTSLAQGAGMLFVFPQSQPVSFWMKDTEIPLSIAFLDADGTILQIEQMEPLDSERRYRSRLSARFAIETHRGWFREYGVRVGDRFEVALPATLEIR